ncbi:MAG TPA: helix-turn-helix domain-containing protein, partial [Polyangia bacterium]|nr:helix-turn-helix domain-containing protein [Polyangia bacterium]
VAEVEAVLASRDLVIDGCRRAARRGDRVVRLARRPVLFALLRALAEAWPAGAARDDLIARAFGARRTNPSHRARLRVEVGRLRHELRPLGDVRATASGFALATRAPGQVRVLAPPIDSPDAAVLALLADGEAWSTSALAMALGSSQRTVQRALVALEQAGQVRALGGGRAQRWLSAPVAGFATPLLLPIAGGFG